MRVVFNNILPVKGFTAINLFGILFVRQGVFISEQLLNHEQIHTAQMKEMLYVFFYLWYAIEWFLKLCWYGKDSYFYVSFEQEAFCNEKDKDYLKQRRLFAWTRYLGCRN